MKFKFLFSLCFLFGFLCSYLKASGKNGELPLFLIIICNCINYDLSHFLFLATPFMLPHPDKDESL